MKERRRAGNRRGSGPKAEGPHNISSIVIMAALGLMTLFVETMLVPGLPHIARELGVGSSDLAWVLTAYTLAGAVSIPIVGKMGEMWGRKRILLAIMAVYMAGLIGAAVSWDLLTLVLSRALQGLGMGAVPLLLGIARDILPPRLAPVGIGLISAMIGVGSATGLVVGGLMISTVGWQNSFWVVLPVTAAVVVVVDRAVPERQARRPAKLDTVGSALLGIALLTLLLGLSRGPAWGWGSVLVLGLFACAAASFAAFVLRERSYSEPVIKLDLLKDRNIAAAYTSMFFIGIVMFMLYQTLPYFLEMPREAGGFGITSQVMIGLILLPNSVAQLISSPLGGRWGQKVGHGRVLLAGFALAIIGLVSLFYLRGTEAGVMASTVVFGFGIGLAMVGQTNLMAAACSKSEFGSAAAVNSTILTIGMSVGPVIASLIIGGLGNDGGAYASTWVVAAVIALLAIGTVFLNKADLGKAAADPASP